MNYNEFCDYVAANAQKYFTDSMAGAEVFLMEKEKLNGGFIRGISVRSEGRPVAPCLYLESAFAWYEQGDNIDDICRELASTLEEKTNARFTFEFSKLTDFDTVKNSITTKVVNAKENRNLLAQRPHTLISDLAVIYQIEVGKYKDELGTIAVDNRIMESWNISTEELHTLAVENAERNDPYIFCNVESMIFGDDANFLEDGVCETDGLLVLTNKSRVFGSNVLANEAVMERVVDVVNDDIYIVPSSIHEVLIISKEYAEQAGMQPSDLGKMIRDINQAEVSPEERLSNHLYEINRDDMELQCVGASMERKKEMAR